MLTILQKSQRYEEALERAKEYWNSPRTCFDIDALKEIFPELKDSEDERVRKEIIDYINRLTASPNNIDKYNTWIAWLEKQGDYNRLVEEMKKWKELLSKEKEKAISFTDRLSLGGRIAMLEELLSTLN